MKRQAVFLAVVFGVHAAGGIPARGDPPPELSHGLLYRDFGPVNDDLMVLNHVGFDKNLPYLGNGSKTDVFDGGILHVRGFFYRQDTALVDPTPPLYPNDLKIALKPGQTFTDPKTGSSVQVLGQTPLALDLNVTLVPPGDMTAPFINRFYPQPLQNFRKMSGDKAVFSFGASDESGISKVTVFNSNLQNGLSDSMAPYVMVYDLSGLNPSETATLGDAVAFDTSGNTAHAPSFNIQKAATLLETGITSPLDGASVNNPVTVTAEASGDFPVTSVEFWKEGDGAPFFTDTSAPYSATLILQENMDHSLWVRAKDSTGVTADSLVTIHVGCGSPPCFNGGTPVPPPSAVAEPSPGVSGFEDAFNPPTAGGSIQGTQNTAVLLLRENENQPNGTTREEVEDLLFGMMNAYYRENSYGKISFAGDIFGWYTVPGFCNTYTTPESVAMAVEAADADVNFQNYSTLVLVAPQCSSKTGGGGQPNTPVQTDEGNFSMAVVWANRLQQWPYIPTHEMGHALGLGHANSVDCGVESLLPYSQPFGCVVDGYGDVFNIMGGGRHLGFDGIAHFAGMMKEYLGWMSPGQVVTPTQSGHFSLEPIESTGTGAKLLKIPRGVIRYPDGTTEDDSLMVEYRQAPRREINLTDDPNSPESNPDVQPSGFRVVFVGGYGSSFGPGIFTQGLDNGIPRRRLTSMPGDFVTPKWSPLWTSNIAFVRNPPENPNPDIWVMDMNGANLINLTNNPAADRDFSWERTGGQLAFISTRDRPDGDVYRVNVDGSSLSRLTATSGNLRVHSPRWSPASSSVVFFCRDSAGGSTLYKKIINGSEVLLRTSTFMGLVDCSPDGARLAFREGNNVFVMNQDGTNAHSVTDLGNDFVSDLRWSPDGKTIAFWRTHFLPGGGLKNSVWTVDPETQAMTLVSQGDSNGPGASEPRWIPR